MFIPNSTIIETGYAQAGQFLVQSTQLPYRGFYHRDDKNRYWSGKTHTNDSFLLTPPTTKPLTLDAFNKNNIMSYGFTKKYSIASAPTLYKGDFVFPTDEDFSNTFFTRYVVQLKSSTSPYVVEINKDNYAKVTQTEDRFYYNVAEMLWKLKGPIDDVFENNVRIEAGVRDTNLRSLQAAEKIIPGVSKIFPDPLQFYF
jgi:hypothetical protein